MAAESGADASGFVTVQQTMEEFLVDGGVNDCKAVATLLREEGLTDPSALLSLDTADIAELLDVCKSKGLSVGNRANLKKLFRAAGIPFLLSGGTGSEGLPRQSHFGGSNTCEPARPQPAGDSKSHPAQSGSASSNPSPPPAASSSTPHADRAQSDSSNSFQAQGANLLASFIVMLQPLREGAANFLDAMAARYLFPFLNQQNRPMGHQSPRPNWMHVTLPRLVAAYAIIRGISSIFVRVDSMLAFLLGFFLRKREAGQTSDTSTEDASNRV